jgi:hypothetical protein
VDLICVQRCQGIMTAVAIGCGPMASPRIGRRLGADADPCIAE